MSQKCFFNTLNSISVQRCNPDRLCANVIHWPTFQLHPAPPDQIGLQSEDTRKPNAHTYYQWQLGTGEAAQQKLGSHITGRTLGVRWRCTRALLQRPPRSICEVMACQGRSTAPMETHISKHIYKRIHKYVYASKIEIEGQTSKCMTERKRELSREREYEKNLCSLYIYEFGFVEHVADTT